MSEATLPTTDRILMLVLTSEIAPYLDMMATTKKLYAAVPNLDVVYYMCGALTPSGPLGLHDGVLYLPGTESMVPGCLVKTMEALRVFAPDLVAGKYKYVFRSNASTVVDVPLFRTALDTGALLEYGAPAAGSLSASYRDPPAGIVDGRYAGLMFGFGTCIILSPRVALRLLAGYDSGEVDVRVVDDVAIGLFIKTHMPDVTFRRFPAWYCKPENYGGEKGPIADIVRARMKVFYRHKCGGHRAVDVLQMGAVVDELMKREVVPGVAKSLKAS